MSTYLKEEILQEQIVRKLDPFQKFLEVASQSNGKIINYTKIDREAGVARALANRVSLELIPSTFEYGDLFEQFLILEFIKLNHYFEKRFKYSYFRSSENNEIDLVIEKPKGEHYLIEIKSSDKINLDEVRKLSSFKSEFRKPTLFYLSQSEEEKLEQDVLCLPWKEGLKRIFDIV